MLLSFLSPSYIVAPKRISANTLFLFDLNTQINSQKPSTGILINIEVNTPRGQSVLSSSNSSRTILVYSDVFFTTYAEYVQVLANNPT